MISVRQSPSFNSSAASSQLEPEDMDSSRALSAAKEVLKSRIFLGRYVERRLINERVGYRDIVVVSAAEVELKKDLSEAYSKLRTAYDRTWIGITESDTFPSFPATGLCLCVEIDNLPFGAFWFQIKSVKARPEEIIVVLKCIRHISDAYLEIEPLLTGSAKVSKSSVTASENVVALNETFEEIKENLKGALSIRNVKEFVTFIFAFVIAIFTGSTAFINFLGNFILALLREISILVKNSTPLFLGFLDFLSKIVGGFYILMAMIFKPSPVPLNKRTLTYHDSQPRNRYDSRYMASHID